MAKTPDELFAGIQAKTNDRSATETPVRRSQTSFKARMIEGARPEPNAQLY